ncbi:NUDIX hydrolase [Gorillibacterium sp. sgz500922]|uniref:NUDIX hydrolase n=1 Tax=Gorillibacterium sp. sgz500922 TaxID=3446694 RepID=UPI003F672697
MDLRDENGWTEQEFLERYRPAEYERPSVAADMAIFTVSAAAEDNYRKLPEKELRVLLIQRGGHPDLGKWALPGGFVRPDETVEQAALRELKEETGVDRVYLEQLGVFSEVGRDPRTWVMSCAFLALADSSRLRLQAGDDAAHAAWFRVGYRLRREGKEYTPGGLVKKQQYELSLTSELAELNATVERTVTLTEASAEVGYAIVADGGLAFDHAKILACAVEWLRSRVNDSALAFPLLPSEFTLTELQQVYEVILDKELLKAAFRRKVADLVEETDRYTENAGHRPSRLYRRKLEALG